MGRGTPAHAWRAGGGMKADVENTEEAIVLLDEEFGYRYWHWHTGLTSEQLIKWWSELKCVEPYTMDPSHPSDGFAPLPGRIIQLPETSEIVKEGFSAHLNDDDDSFLMRNGIYFFHRGYTGPDLNIPRKS